VHSSRPAFASQSFTRLSLAPAHSQQLFSFGSLDQIKVIYLPSEQSMSQHCLVWGGSTHTLISRSSLLCLVKHTRYQEGLLRVPVHTLHIPTMPCSNIHQNPNPIHQLAPLLFICNNSTKQWSISHGYKPMVKGMPICSSDKCPRCTPQKYELARKGILGTRISRIATCDSWHHLPDTAMNWIWALRKMAPINWSSMYCQLMCLKDAFKSTG
jgi:hypothetical protein